ncbi:MAG: DUF3800 domain-containing protein [Prevotellaceae bacterium]|jgi:hypothetical protein|nr:DUF3800 domain-containing protein [Prevotellaceae bacterium]
MDKTFNIYCDESCHLENDHKPFMFLGSVSSAYNQVKLHTAQINELKRKHCVYAEIKWSKVSQSKYLFYSELINYFFSTDLKFRTVGIEKAKINNPDFGQTYDDFYYKMYYQLLNHKIDSRYSYNVYLDIKDTLSACKVRRLREILNTKYGVFRNVQNIRSHESVLMQLADFLTGAISYYKNNEEKKNQEKVQLIEKIIKKSGHDLDRTNYSEKLNLFFIELE